MVMKEKETIYKTDHLPLINTGHPDVPHRCPPPMSPKKCAHCTAS
jgi:hypothetical protein